MNKGRVLFLSKRRDAASTRYRIFQYWDFLRELGWDLDYVSAGEGRLALLRKSARADVVVIQRKLLDPVTLGLLKRINPRLVFDYDDAIFLNDNGSPSPRRARGFARVSAAARLCLAGNDYLARHSACAHTEVFPTTVKLSDYAPFAERKSPAADPLTLVWIGSRSTSKYLEEYRSTLEALGESFADIELKIIGDFEMDLAPLKTRCVEWTAEGELTELASAHIGVAPMVDDPWTRGKCALKVIQYMACGLPVISSNSGANGEIIQHGKTGFLAGSPQEWIAAVEQLQDNELRSAMGRAAFHRVRKHYSAEAMAERMDQLFTMLLNQRKSS